MGEIEDYARLVVRVGVAVREGQDVLVSGLIEQAPFLRAIAEEAYRAGARHVDVDYGDPWIRRALVAEGRDESLGWSPPWMVARMEQAAENGAAVIHVSGGSNADVYEGLDLSRLARARMPEVEKAWLKAATDRAVAWTIVAFPTERWATEILGEPDVDRLWRAVAHVMRLDEADPAAAWSARLDELEARAAALTARGFDAIRYRGPGTELEVGLIDGAAWLGGGGRTADGHWHAPNLPTEEVFTSPHRDGADGVVRASMPFSLYGTMIDGLELRLAGGEIVEANARAGETVVRTVLATDDGARYLGELALVDDGSRVADTGVLFRNTLFDENAASHIAWGSGFPEVLGDPPPADHQAHGVNDSRTHVDFMVGSDELEISGVEPGGAVVPILAGGAWQLAD